MATLAVRHAWLQMPARKRKVSSESPSPASSDSSDLVTPRAPKRRRCEMLERGLAHLSLDALSGLSVQQHWTHVPSPHSAHLPISDTLVRSSSYDSTASVHALSTYPVSEPLHPTPGNLPYSTHETSLPQEVEIEDVPMSKLTWYEPEKDRIVITDLTDSDDEGEQSLPPETGITVPAAVIAHIRQQAQTSSVPPLHEAPDMSKALVLFRPPPLLRSDEEHGQEPEQNGLQEEEGYTADNEGREEDDMDMDVEM